MRVEIDKDPVSISTGDWSCPLRSDVNSCSVVIESRMNACPKLDDEGENYSYPEWCPLRNGPVQVAFRSEKENQ